MSTDKLRLAIVGAGLIARNSHLPAALGSRRASVTAIVDPATERAAALAEDYGIDPAITPAVEQALDRFDAAIVCTPNHTHAPIAETCLHSGKHVLIDNPMATSVAEAERILAAAETGGDLTVAVGYATRFRESVELMKALLDDQAFGPIRSFVNRFGTSGGWSPKSGYILDRATAGGGVLVVSGTHFLDRMLYWFGEPSSSALESDAEGGPEANCRASFRFETPQGEFEGHAIYSKTASLPAGTVVDTEQGFLLLGEFDSSPVVFRPHDRPDTEHIVTRRGNRVFAEGAGSFELQMDDFIAACLDDRRPLVDGRQGLASMRLLHDLYDNNTPLRGDWYG